MCKPLSELRRAMQHYAADFDAALYSAADREQIAEHAAAVEKMAAAVKSEAAARAAATGWRASGSRSAAEHVARARR
ncbi:MAG: hypothetical protein M3179_05335, partial [Actinomycetota bacterium]|nr:hypothetical protein [Actinomycetota bacterium]